VLLAGLAAAALALRLAWLADVPRVTDELVEMLHAYRLAAEGRVPLVNDASYIGGLVLYLVAPVYWLFGPQIEHARLVMGLAGVATLLPTYWLGRRLAGRSAVGGLVAAALLAVSAPHILVGRLAWSHSLTPLFAALAVWLLARAVEERHGPSLAWAGLAAGLALQTHPTVAVLLPAGLAYLLIAGRRLALSRWGLLGAGLVLAANLNLALYNLATRGGSASGASLRQADYVERERSSYPAELAEIVLGWARLLSGALTDRVVTGQLLWPPVLLIVGGLVLGGLVLCARRGQWLPLALVASATVLFPTFLSQHDPLVTRGRYLMPLLPVCLAAAGAAVAGLAGRPVAPLRTALAAPLVLVVLGGHLAALRGYVGESLERGLTNARYREAEAVLRASADEGEVLVDGELEGEGTHGGGKLSKVFAYLLETNRLPYRVVQRPAREPLTDGASRVMVLHTSTVRAFGPRAELTPLLPAVNGLEGSRFGIYRVRASGT
jgi:4-amino-4-deoxy-L-arabinose transferase-like glycosyltransferase